jgi:hypothetical protein
MRTRGTHATPVAHPMSATPEPIVWLFQKLDTLGFEIDHAWLPDPSLHLDRLWLPPLGELNGYHTFSFVSYNLKQ